MSQSNQAKVNKAIDEYECSGNGPRPPVPGKESKMTEASSTASATAAGPSCSVNVTASANASNANVGGSVRSGSIASLPPFTGSPTEDAQAESIRVAKWNEHLDNLLADKKGMDLFRRFVEHEAGPHGIHTIRLEFLFACEGLKEHSDENMMRQIIGAIYRKYLRSNIPLKTELKNRIKRVLKNELPPTPNIYDELKKDVQEFVNNTTYPNFLMSDYYRDYATRVKKMAATSPVYGEPVSTMSSGSNVNSGPFGSYGASSVSGGASAIGPLSPCDSLAASCSNLQESMISSATLPTLHEDSELKMNDVSTSRSMNVAKPKLTREMLLATQSRRLEVRPPGAHGYNISFSSSFNPVSRQESEYHSCSSASLTDSETKSLASAKDGQTYFHRKHPSESVRNNYINPLDQTTETLVEPISRSRLKSSKPLDQKTFNELVSEKLERILEERERHDRLDRSLSEIQSQEEHLSRNRPNVAMSATHQKALTEAILRKISQQTEDNDQDILDQHVSRVFSPLVSPGTSSPHQTIAARPLPPLPTLVESVHSNTSFGMRHSKSIPCKPSSNNYDSGISLGYSTYKSKPTNRESQVEEARKVFEDESRRNRNRPSSSTHHTNSLPRQNEEYTFAVYTFCDESMRYRTKIPGTQPTLKQFKEYLPKKGSFRFFFTTADTDCSCIQEEIYNDSDILPIYDGKIMGMVKPK